MNENNSRLINRTEVGRTIFTDGNSALAEAEKYLFGGARSSERSDEQRRIMDCRNVIAQSEDAFSSVFGEGREETEDKMSAADRSIDDFYSTLEKYKAA